METVYVDKYNNYWLVVSLPKWCLYFRNEAKIKNRKDCQCFEKLKHIKNNKYQRTGEFDFITRTKFDDNIYVEKKAKVIEQDFKLDIV